MMQHSSAIRKKVRAQLQAKTDAEYKTFNDKIAVPGYPTIGVRTPDMRAIAKELSKGPDWSEYLTNIETSAASGEEMLFEEVMVWATTIGYATMSFEQRLERLDRFVPFIRDWATCDVCISGYKFINKNKEEMWEYLRKWLKSTGEFEIRFPLVCFLGYYVEEDYLDHIFTICEQTDQDLYYVQMAIAWLLSVCYIRYPRQTEPFIKNNALSVWTHNKAIQKIRESRRVDQSDKDRLNQLKRK